MGGDMIQYSEERTLELGLPTERQDSDNMHKYKVVSIRLRAAEFEAFCEQAHALGMTSNLALRIAARRIGGFLEVDDDSRRKLNEILDAIGDVSCNIKDLYNIYNERDEINLDGLAEQRAAFGEEFAKLDGLLRSILNVSKRRSDGQRKLAAAAA
jgi:type IV secretion system T-DNA border endonuclease VirD1